MAVPLFDLAPDLTVSRLCLGTMTFGEQNTLPESLQLLDKAFDAGINFFDSAEILLRVQTDYIDLYQIHWPDRYVPMFGETEYDPNRYISSVSFEEQLNALGRAVDAGKIRYVGLSNETPYGIMKFIQVAESGSCYPRVVSVQVFMAKSICVGTGTGTCVYSSSFLSAKLTIHFPVFRMHTTCFAEILILGWLNAVIMRGKYSEAESRYNFSNTNMKNAAKEYINIAKKYGVHPVWLAIAFVLKNPLVASAIFGATKLWQLQEVIDASRFNLSPQIIAEINRVHSRFPNPCP